MKEKVISLLKTFLVILIASGITAYATSSYFANQIVYANQNGIDMTVDQALDDLYYASSNFANPTGSII